jgi:uncharacterized membrane protein YhaH (DUF805 family)
MARMWGIFEGRMRRSRYFAAGIVLVTAKFWLDFAIAWAFGHSWSPLVYVSPRLSPFVEAGTPIAFPLALLGASLPFLWVGMGLTVRRLRDAGLPTWWAGFMLMPYVHVPLFLVWAVVPPARRESLAPEGGPYRMPPSAALETRGRFLDRAIPSHVGVAFCGTLLVNLVLGSGVLASLRVLNLRDRLGLFVFVGEPFAIGFLTALVMARRGRGRGAAIGYSLLTLLAGLLVLLIAGYEGMACLILASPLVAGICVLGALVGHGASGLGDRALGFFALPLLALVPAVHPPRPTPLSVESVVRVAAPPDAVWRNLIAFPPITAPPEPIFAIAAMPLEARIDGVGPGAVRHCRFTNGTFVEPVTVWDPNRELAFGVRAQPPGLEGILEVVRGQFLLEANPDGTTTMRGTTWYALDMAPAIYWQQWTQRFIHAIHMRVLRHIAILAEHPETARASAPAAQPPWMAAVARTCRCTQPAE